MISMLSSWQAVFIFVVGAIVGVLFYSMTQERPEQRRDYLAAVRAACGVSMFEYVTSADSLISRTCVLCNNWRGEGYATEQMADDGLARHLREHGPLFQDYDLRTRTLHLAASWAAVIAGMRATGQCTTTAEIGSLAGCTAGNAVRVARALEQLGLIRECRLHPRRGWMLVYPPSGSRGATEPKEGV